MTTPFLRITVSERVCICIALFALAEMQLWTFADIANLYLAAALFCIFSLAAKGKITLLICGILSVTCFVTATVQAITVRPLPTRIAGTYFEQAPLPEVLQFLAKQNTNFPSWEFFIYDRELAEQKLTLEIPKASTLGDALHLVSDSAGCEISYHWVKGCGNAHSPISATFNVTKPGTKATFPKRVRVMVYRDYIWWPSTESPTNPVAQPQW